MNGNRTVPDFLTKTYKMVNNQSNDHLVSWSPSGTSFVISRKFEFTEHVLPLFFNHSNFSSFNRQLNKYGFRNINKYKWEFAHNNFVKGQPQLLHNIVRRQKAYNLPSTAELTHLREETERLRREKRSLQLKVEQLKREKESCEEEIQRLKMNTEDLDKRFESKENIIFEDIIKDKAKLLEIDLNSLPDSDVVEDSADVLSSR